MEVDGRERSREGCLACNVKSFLLPLACSDISMQLLPSKDAGCSLPAMKPVPRDVKQGVSCARN